MPLRSFLQLLAITCFIALMLGARAILYPIIEAGGIVVTAAIIAACFAIAHRIDATGS